jgi:transcriptional regulator with GAF, ATPase, and Fis domain
MVDDDANSEEAAFIRVLPSLTGTLDLDRTCEATLDAVEHIFGAASGWILLHDPAVNHLITAACRGQHAEPYADRHIPCGTGIVGRAFTTRDTVFVPDVTREHRWADPACMHRSGLRSVLTAPLVYEGDAIGIVGFESPRYTAAAPPAPCDLARMKAVATQAAIGIRNARLFAEIEHDRVRLRQLLEQRRSTGREVDRPRSEMGAGRAFADIVGVSCGLRSVLEQVEIAAAADCTVLLTGETGTGKELIARALHERSRRSRNPFLALNCAALPESLVESELFGYEKGAFTDALHRKPGQFELAHQGTLFLDEVGDLPLPMQGKLLRVIQEREVRRIGGTRCVRVDVRLVAATNQDLNRRIADGQFRLDLYYRLNVFPIRLSPLRERLDDIPVLAEHFVRRFAARLRKPITGLSRGAIQRLLSHHWPGNVRELQNAIERAVILTTSPVVPTEMITLADPLDDSKGPITWRADTAGGAAEVMRLSEAERRAILCALGRADWRISGSGGAADLLGVKPTTLHAKLKKLEIRRPTPRDRAAQGSSRRAGRCSSVVH